MKIRNIGIVTLVTVAGTLTLTGCSKNDNMYQKSLEDVIIENKSKTKLDEILKEDRTIFVIINDYEESKRLKDSINYLEDAINITEKISSSELLEKIDIYEDLNDEQKKLARNLSKEEIYSLIDEYYKTNDKDLILNNLYYINNYYRSYIKDNGIKISYELMNMIVNSKACNLEKDSYRDCYYNDDYKIQALFPKMTITNKNKNKVYSVTKKSGVYYDAVEQLDSLMLMYNSNGFSYNDIRKTVIDTFNIAKLNIASNIKENNNKIKTTSKKENIEKVNKLKGA